MANKYKVPVKQWRNWSEQARGVFNEVYYTVRNNHKVLFPEKAHDLPKQTLRVMAWNTAWIAADAANR